TLALAAASPLGAQDVGLAVGTKAPVVAVEDLDGKSVDLGQYIGRQPVVLEFWATWCPLCKALEPSLKAAHARYGRTVRFLAIGVTRSIAPASSLYACGSISRNGAITCAIFPSGPTTNRSRLSSPYLGLMAPYVLPITLPLSLANRYGNSSSRAHAASVSAG